MAAAPQCSQVAAQAGLDALLAVLNAGGQAGRIKIFSGGAPSNCEAADTGTKLAELTLSSTAFAAATTITSPVRGAQASANAITDDTDADATGTAGYFRAYKFDGSSYTCVIQGTCATASADMILNTTSIVEHATVSCTSWTVTLPDGG